MNILPVVGKAVRHFAVSLSVPLLLLALAGPAFASSPVGEQKTVVLLVNFQDDPVQPITVAEAYSRVFGTVGDLYWEASYQRTFFSGNVYGWYTIPMSKTVCDTNLIAAEADKAAVGAGVNLAAYDRIIYFFTQNACSGGGYNAGPTAVPSRTWLQGNVFTLGAIAHELGHSFGMSHAQGMDCGADVLGSNCVARDGFDPADGMGSGPMKHFNARQKELMGWLNASGQPPITTVTTSGTYSIDKFETVGSSAKALKVAKGVDAFTGQMSYYYVEYRQPSGFDAGLASIGNLTSGVLIHVGGKSQLSQLVDLTPGSLPDYISNDFNDAALTVGRSFSDPSIGLTVTLLSADAAHAVVEVRVAGTVQPPPPAGGTLTESVATDKTNYTRGETVYLSARTLNSGTPVPGATIKFTLSTPGGGTTIINANSGSDGFARSTYKVGKAKGAIGSYGVRADASSSIGSGSATTGFSAK